MPCSSSSDARIDHWVPISIHSFVKKWSAHHFRPPLYEVLITPSMYVDKDGVRHPCNPLIPVSLASSRTLTVSPPSGLPCVWNSQFTHKVGAAPPVDALNYFNHKYARIRGERCSARECQSVDDQSTSEENQSAVPLTRLLDSEPAINL